MKKLLKIMSIICLCVTVVACTKQEEKLETLNILTPSGAPSLAFVGVYDEVMESGKIDIVDGPDVLVAELSKKDSTYDIIVAPINVGAKLIETEQTDYRIAGVVTWGNLYIVGEKGTDLNTVPEIALFGQNTVPQFVFDASNLGIEGVQTYYNSATLVQQQLLSSKVKAGLLAEPLATATIAKAKEASLELEILADLQSEYGSEGYPQAAVFVKKGSDHEALFAKIDDFTNEGYPDMEEKLESIGAETLKIPSVSITMSTLERQNVRFVYAQDAKEQMADFLKLFTITFNDDMMNT